ncbi:MAG TPA: PLD nuclease N-terminal domain-containing protein [Anaerolineae bacterium]|nr:PLD nuclease N-terminal domain-containing protein [Anaerolineae bacterium]HQI87706.1 PLD nuclease N-terminal domain-containing protein [Anaerolineae bacterium]
MTINDFMPYLPLIIPIVLIDLGLKIAALFDILKKQPKLRGPKWLWIVIAVGVNLIGPILYFTLGREEA